LRRFGITAAAISDPDGAARRGRDVQFTRQRSGQGRQGPAPRRSTEEQLHCRRRNGGAAITPFGTPRSCFSARARQPLLAEPGGPFPPWPGTCGSAAFFARWPGDSSRPTGPRVAARDLYFWDAAGPTGPSCSTAASRRKHTSITPFVTSADRHPTSTASATATVKDFLGNHRVAGGRRACGGERATTHGDAKAGDVGATTRRRFSHEGRGSSPRFFFFDGGGVGGGRTSGTRGQAATAAWAEPAQ